MKKLFKKKEKSTEVKKAEVEAEMGFLDHLEQLRWHILRSFAAVFVIGIAVFIAKDFVFGTIIFGPLKESFPTFQMFCTLAESMCFGPPKMQLDTINIGEQFIIHIKSSIMIGFICSFPYVFWEIWRFVKPGLYDKEKKYTRGVVVIASLLFISGVLFGYFIISPFALNFLGNYTVAENVESGGTLASYITYMFMFTLPTGIIFQLPIVVYFLSKIGLVTPEFMKKYRRHAIVVILILAAIITPPDIITQFLIGIPVYFLYEISIIISKRVQPDPDF
ncbi:twin-arginine translocase subunit TatC [Portibacter marinus]|uniref:twin-arginine translocase subunit TatC n=1 Tax=Portibacter marinus TaxID=2898660 RepID=UPI001F4232A0|nr:twin-arginine translocase subunit TatC [Portibacter marinus]